MISVKLVESPIITRAMAVPANPIRMKALLLCNPSEALPQMKLPTIAEREKMASMRPTCERDEPTL